jgi:hypothetical protein
MSIVIWSDANWSKLQLGPPSSLSISCFFLIYLYLLKYKIRKIKVIKDIKNGNKRRYPFDAWVLVQLYPYAWFSMILEIVNVDNNKMFLLYVLLFIISYKISYCFIVFKYIFKN